MRWIRMSPNLEHLHRVHCIGVGGIGVSAVAKLLRLQGKEVSGSDLQRSEVTEDAERAGVIVRDEDPSNVAPDLDLLIYTSAAPDTHPEREAAAKFGIPQMSYFEFLGLLSQGRETVAVCGTNGKSTTTAMLGLILEAAGLDPLVIVGSKVTSFPYGNLRAGKGNLFVIEACEHQANFLHLSPKHAVVTNVTEDHLDYYRDLDHIRETFQKFIATLPDDGLLALNADDPVSSSRLKPKGRSITYGIGRAADYRAVELETRNERQHFAVVRKEPPERWEAMSLRVPGHFNVQNALAAAAMARELGVSAEVIRTALEKFPGIWRRFERVGRTPSGAEVISDYGHHPDAVRATLEAAREFFPGRKILLAFQPHQHDRTRKLFDGFVASFDAADELILSEIYGVAGRMAHAGEISSKDLVKAALARDRAAGRGRSVRYAADLEETRGLAGSMAGKGEIVIVMGAGSIYTIVKKLVA